MSLVRLQRIAADDGAAHEAAVDVTRRGFLPREAACTGAGVTRSPQAVEELLDLVRAALEDGVSVAAYLGDDLVGVAVNKIQVLPPAGEKSFFERFHAERSSDPRARFVLDFMLRVDAMHDLFAEADGGPLLEVMFLGVAPEAGRRGVGLQVVRESLEVAKTVVGVKAVSAIFTSDYSRAIGRKLGFRELAVAEHADFLFDGRPISDALAAHQQRSVLVLYKL